MVKVSVIVPVYNVELYLEKCLDSLVTQTLSELEILIVDDGATDQSGVIIDRYSEKYENIRSFRKENGGLSDARNFGLRYATGEYIAFLDSDDYVEASMYELLYRKAKEDDSDIVECNLFHDYPEKTDSEYGSHIYDKGQMIRDGRSVVWNKIYRRSWLEGTGVFFPKGLIYEDVNFYCKIVPYIRKISYIDDVLIHYVQRESSINHNSTVKTKQIFQILEDIYAFYKEKGIYEEYRESLEYLSARILLCSSFLRMVRIEDKSERADSLAENYEMLEKNFPHWRKNPYLNGKIQPKKLYIKCMNRPFYWIISKILRLKYH